MRKYLFRVLTILLAIGLNAFTIPKNLDHKFKLSVNPVGTNLQTAGTTTVGGVTADYYINWDEVISYVCPSANDKGCAIEISNTRVYDFGGTIGKRIVADQRNGSLSPGVTNYTMSVVNGYLETVSPFTQYKIINPTDDVTNIILIRNRTTPHI